MRWVFLLASAALTACGTDIASGGTSDGSPTSCGTRGVSYPCGGDTCTDALPVCCQYTSLPSRCVARGAGCAIDGGVPRMQSTQCDDANDCRDGEVCVRSFNKGTSQTDILCAAGRSSLSSQVCKLSCECLDGGTCDQGTCR